METIILALTAVCISLFTLAIGFISLNRLQDKQEKVNQSINNNISRLKDLTEIIKDKGKDE